MNPFSFLTGWHIILGMAGGAVPYYLVMSVVAINHIVRDGSMHGWLFFVGNGAILLTCMIPVMLFLSIRAIIRAGNVRTGPLVVTTCIGVTCMMMMEFGPLLSLVIAP